jgi:hypothetical protein
MCLVDMVGFLCCLSYILGGCALWDSLLIFYIYIYVYIYIYIYIYMLVCFLEMITRVHMLFLLVPYVFLFEFLIWYRG